MSQSFKPNSLKTFTCNVCFDDSLTSVCKCPVCVFQICTTCQNHILQQEVLRLNGDYTKLDTVKLKCSQCSTIFLNNKTKRFCSCSDKPFNNTNWLKHQKTSKHQHFSILEEFEG